MQSFVVHVPQMAGWRTLTSSGDTMLWTKWNCPMGQTYLQKAAPWKMPSIAKAATKYVNTTQAVSQGLAQRSKASYAQKKTKSTPIASHLLRMNLGQGRLAGKSFLAKRRGSINGHAIQKRLPAISSSQHHEAAPMHPREYAREVL